jgi:D-hexose-6-phosphate mutarotase
MMDIEDLNRQFGIPGVAEFEDGKGDLARLVIAAEGSVAEVYLLGGHVTRWTPVGGQDVLWLSRASHYEIGKPIRGGIPVCLPWFGPLDGDPSAPIHGYVRLTCLNVESVAMNDDGSVSAVLWRKFEEPPAENWPGNFELRVRVTVGPSLSVAAEVLNLGQRDLVLGEALHTYFRVSDVRKVSVTGLAGAGYWNKVTGTRAVQGPDPVTFAAQTDRVYLNSAGEVVLHDEQMGRDIRIAKRGSKSTVVWNPWVEKAAAMPDFGDDEWPEMLCIETANALDDSVAIPPGKMHTMETIISVRPGK